LNGHPFNRFINVKQASMGKDTLLQDGWERHVVLVAPEIHWNTGNIGRTCLGAGARLHLIRPLGFSLDSRMVKRAGLDYWERVSPVVWDSFDAFYETMSPAEEEIALFSKAGGRLFWKIAVQPRMFLVFGSETGGLPQSIRSRFPRSCYRIPITSEIRSLNLSTAAGIALYESLRSMPAAEPVLVHKEQFT
jgi:tRNA (cytidine/uridine-2'-O-)-methyltransferase